MSVKALQWAFEQRLANPYQQVVLYTIADWADPNGVARQCDLAHLADCARLSATKVRKHLSEMRTAGTIDTAEKFAEDGARVYDISIHLEKTIAVKREPVPEGAKHAKPSPPSSPASIVHRIDSIEAKAIKMLHDIAGRTTAFFSICRRPDGIRFSKEVTPQLAALARAPAQSAWIVLSHQQAGAWEAMLGTFFGEGVIRNRLREGSRAPWPFPPSVDGKTIYTTATGPPDTLMTADDCENLK